MQSETKQNAGDRILALLRAQILEGEIKPGTRLTEIATSEALGVSRTPVRLAFRELAKEGYLETHGARGYAVREVTPEDLRQALQLRGILEGEAARRLAHLGISPEVQQILEDCVAQTGALFRSGQMGPDLARRYSELNRIFHDTIVETSGCRQLESSVTQLSLVPGGMIRAINVTSKSSAQEYCRLLFGHTQHQLILQAIKDRDAGRAEALMREHAFVRVDYGPVLQEALGDMRVPFDAGEA